MGRTDHQGSGLEQLDDEAQCARRRRWLADRPKRIAEERIVPQPAQEFELGQRKPQMDQCIGLAEQEELLAVPLRGLTWLLGLMQAPQCVDRVRRCEQPRRCT